MEHISSCIADRLVLNQIIDESDRIYYSYSIQLILERIVGISLICIASLFVHAFFQIAVFLMIFAVVRMSCDGYHCKTSIGCFIVSVLVSLSTVPVSYVYLLCPEIYQVWMILSVIFIFCVGTIRDPNLGLTEREWCHLKKRSRITIVMVGIPIIVLMILVPRSQFVSYMALGVVYSAISLMIVKIKGEEVPDNE
ncbi:MAG: accessory gene regulator B family protein [Saccharofermentans sp.]|nr:accessory gene regulator B family protein [Saccharofermentans sp.]